MGSLGGRGVVVALLLFNIAGCLEATLVDCHDGTLCPNGYTCSAAGCLSPDQLTACSGNADGDACNVPVLGNGTCVAGGCVVLRCGNGVVEPGEVCDDGNENGGDGCSSTCKSDETCGNGIVELAEACDCGSTERPGSSATCNGTVNGGAVCNVECRFAGCGDAYLDPGEACDDGNTFSGDGCSNNCLSNETCGNGIVDVGEICDCGSGQAGTLTICAATANGGGICSVDCMLSRCGDGYVDPQEMCDDSNTAAGDGCAADCSAFEVCGEGVFSPTLGEQCDDADLQSGDGCDSRCLLETFSWQMRQCGEPSFLDVYERDTTFDVARGRLVQVEGSSGPSGVPGQVREWDGQRWHCGVRAALDTVYTRAYDPDRQVVVVFARSPSPYSDIVLEWNGTIWTQRAATTSLSGKKLAYDTTAHKFVAYNPANRTQVLTWDASTNVWTTIVTSGTLPPATSGFELAFDASRDGVVGVFENGTSQLVLKWDRATSKWISLPTLSLDITPQIVYHAGRGQLVAYDLSKQVWGLGATAWTQLTTTAGPDGTLHYDPASASLIVSFRFASSPGDAIWHWTNPVSGWTSESATDLYPADAIGVASFPPGGYGAAVIAVTSAGVTWGWNGSVWSVVPTITQAPWSSSVKLAYDPSCRCVMGFDGTTLAAFDGATWQALASTPTPVPVALTFDGYRNELVMMTSNADVFVRSGSTWIDLPITQRALYSPSLAYDAVTKSLVMVSSDSTGNSVRRAFALAPSDTTWSEFYSFGYVSYTVVAHPLRGTVMFIPLFTSPTLERSSAIWPQFAGMPMYTDSGRAVVFDAVRGEYLGVSGQAGFGTPMREVTAGGFRSATPRETCVAGADVDGDGRIECNDPDCWWSCGP